MPGDGLNPIEIDDPGDPRVRDYTDLKADAELERSVGAAESIGASSARHGLFVAEGEWVVRCLVESRYRVRSVLATPKRIGSMADVLARLPAGTPVYAAGKRVINEVVGFPMHRGVVALGERSGVADAAGVMGSCGVLVVLEDLCNQDNVGGVFRGVAALGGVRAGVLLSPRCCDPLYRKAIRVSMGHALRVPFAVVEDWPRGLGALRTAGFTVIALTTDAEALPIEEVGRVERPAVLLGSEGYGLSAAAKEAAELRMRIPMAAGVDSLNVAVAAGIALHRLCRVG